jgi:tRNA threonylcarbamoyladenosine biosynthesis protein TsaB
MSITPVECEVALTSNSASDSLIVLAVDTASETASYAVARDGVLVASRVAEREDRPSETLFRSISKVLKDAEVELDQVNLFCAVSGPGSFTGLRVSLAALLGIAQTLKRPAIGYDTFDAWALSDCEAGTVLVIVNAGRGEVYGGLRVVGPGQSIKKVSEDMVGPSDRVISELVEPCAGPVILIGPGVELARADLKTESEKIRIAEPDSPRAASLAAAIALHSARAPIPEQRPLRPYYLRKADAR